MFITVGPYRLAGEFFEKRKLRNQCVNGTCSGACCKEGVYLNLYDAQRIVAHQDKIQPYLAEPFDFSKWDFSRPSYISTPVRHADTPHETCWFQMHNQRCAIHAYALDAKITLKDIKPYFCLFFPLTLTDIDINVSEIGVDPKAYDTCLVASETEAWLYQQFEDDLRQAIGDEYYAEIKRRFP